MAAGETNGTSSNSDIETIKISPEKFYLPQNSWFQRKVLYRLAWLGSLIGCAVSLPFVVLKTAWQLITLRPIKALKTLVFGTLGCLGIGLASAISIFSPSFVWRSARTSLLEDIINLMEDNNINLSPVPTDARFVSPVVESDKGYISTIQTIKPANSQNLLIQFTGLGCVIEIPYIQNILDNYSSVLNRHVRSFNYPGIDPAKPNASYVAESRVDFVNAASAHIYEFLNANNWQKQAISRIQLIGHSLGGAVALQVAKRFKEFGIDIPVHVDRSFGSLRAVVAARINRITHIPLACSSVIARAALYGGGDLEMDSTEACGGLNPKMVHWYNLGHVKNGILYTSPPKTWLRKLLEFVGLGRFSRTLEEIGNVRAFEDDADEQIPDFATLQYELEKMHEEKMHEKETAKAAAGNTTAIFREFNVDRKKHILFDRYQRDNDSHNAYFFNLETAGGIKAKELLRSDIQLHDPPEDAKTEPAFRQKIN